MIEKVNLVFWPSPQVTFIYIDIVLEDVFDLSTFFLIISTTCIIYEFHEMIQRKGMFDYSREL